MREGLPINLSQPQESRERILPHKRMVRDYAMPQVEQSAEHEPKHSFVLMGQQEKALFPHFYRSLPETHEVVRGISEILKEVAGVMGVSVEGYSVMVYESHLPDAHVQLYGKVLRISNTCLEAIEGDRDMLRAIIAHEVGHVLLQHDDEIEKKEFKEFEEKPVWDPLQDRVMSYEAEYQADRTSAFALHRLNVDTSAMRRCLARLDAYAQKIIENEEDDTSYLDGYEGGSSWVLETHPHTTRRAIALMRLERLLEAPPLKQANSSSAFRASPEDFSPLFMETESIPKGIWAKIKDEEYYRAQKEKAERKEREEKREKESSSNEKIEGVVNEVIVQELKDRFDESIEEAKKRIYTTHSVDCFWDERE
ncbi:MAG: M48 family metalloprotease, partial [bacterium]|nr:M48 family metalloprotease [bacterium]